MTTHLFKIIILWASVVEAYRLGKYDNKKNSNHHANVNVVEAYRLGKYDNLNTLGHLLSHNKL